MSFAKALREAAIKYLPRTPAFDRRVHMLQFMQRSAGTPPSTALSFRDKIFRKLTGTALDDVLVKATTDRLHVKKYIDGTLLRQAAIRTEAVFRDIEDIKEYNFKPGFMLRTTHSYVVPQIISVPKDLSFVQLDEWLQVDYYHEVRERNYKGLQPGILLEPYLIEGKAPNMVVAFCYNGQMSLLHTLEYKDGGKNRFRRFYSLDWEPLDFSIWDKLSEPIPKPADLENFISDCARLSEPFEIVAVEALFYDNGTYVFTGLSHCPDGNGAKIVPVSSTDEFNARFFRSPPYDMPNPKM